MISNELVLNGRVIFTMVQYGLEKVFGNFLGVTRADK